MFRITVLCALATLLVPHLARGADSLWTYAPSGAVRFVRAAPEGMVVVASEGALSGIDADSGAERWTRPDLGSLARSQVSLVPTPPLLLVHHAARGGRPSRIEAVEVPTGRTRWRSDSLDLPENRGEWIVPDHGLILLLCSSRDEDRWSVAAVDLAGGAVRWTAADWFAHRPRIVSLGARGEAARPGPQPMRPPLLDSDTTMIVDVSADGPVRVDLRDGRVRWRADNSRFGFWQVPGDLEFWQPLVLRDGFLFVGNGDDVMALDAANGRFRWRKPASIAGSMRWMEWTPRGLLALGQDRLLLFDPMSGRSVWPRRVSFRPPASCAVRGDSIYLAAEGFLTRVDLASGGWKDMARIRLGKGEALDLEVSDGGVRVRSSQGVAGYDLAGRLTYQFPPAESALLPGLVSGLGTALRIATIPLAVYFQPYFDVWDIQPASPARPRPSLEAHVVLAIDHEDGTGSALLEIDRAGAVVDSIPLRDRRAPWSIDPAGARAYIVQGTKRVVGYRF